MGSIASVLGNKCRSCNGNGTKTTSEKCKTCDPKKKCTSCGDTKIIKDAFCQTCNITGFGPIQRNSVVCGDCSGHGTVEIGTYITKVVKCQRCGGFGRLHPKKCPECNSENGRYDKKCPYCAPCSWCKFGMITKTIICGECQGNGYKSSCSFSQ